PFNCQRQAMPGAPQQEGPVSTVPKPAKQHGQQQIAIGLNRAVAVTAQGDVQVIAQPGGKADVPPTPELGDALADIGLVEVLVKTEPHHQPQANGHVRIPGKVEVQLRGVGQNAQPGVGGTGARQGKCAVCQGGDGVCDKDFLDKAL